MRRYLFIIFFLFANSISAQIKNPEFKLMLDSIYELTVPLISVADLIKMDKQNMYILDTREEEEYDVSHLKNARHVGYIWFDMRTIYDIPMDANVVLYCTVGSRSEKIAGKLLAAGYKNVYNLYGGIFEWINERNPVYKRNGVQTSEIHTYDKALSRWVDRGSKVN